MSRYIKSGCYNGKICYGGIIQCIQGDISIEGMDAILDLMDSYCYIQELLSSEEKRNSYEIKE